MRGHIRRRGTNSWELKYDIEREEGGRHTVYRSFQGSKREAQAELARLLARAADGGHVDPSRLTVAEYVRSRLAQWRAKGEVAPKTAERYDQLIKHQIVPYIGSRLLQKLTSHDVETWHMTLLGRGRHNGRGGISARTVGHAHRILAKALREGMRHALVLKNVATIHRVPKVAADEMVILTAEQVAALPAQLAGHPLAAITIVALFTGMRRGEILALRWGNVDLAAKTIHVRESLEKTQAGIRFKGPKSRAGARAISLPSIVLEALQGHRRELLERRLLLGLGKLKDIDLVFPTWNGQPQDPDVFSTTWATAAKKLGLNVSIHSLRHTHASQLIDAGVDIVTISKRLGHSSPAVTLRAYAHLFAEGDNKAAAAINAALGVPVF